MTATRGAMIAWLLVVLATLTLAACGDDESPGGGNGGSVQTSDGRGESGGEGAPNGNGGNGDDNETNGGNAGDGANGDNGGTSNEVVLGPVFFQPTPIRIGRVSVGSSGETSLTLRNVGDVPRVIVGLQIEDDANEFQIASDDCQQTELGPSGTCGVRVTFTPAASGTRDATLTIQADPGPGRSVAIEGEGAGPADAEGDSTVDPEDDPMVDPEDDPLVDPDTGTSSDP
jgi:Abnormal spindle-like microcephaly-assoc'd, ASPM-SPD-2-Hydin